MVPPARRPRGRRSASAAARRRSSAPPPRGSTPGGNRNVRRIPAPRAGRRAWIDGGEDPSAADVDYGASFLSAVNSNSHTRPADCALSVNGRRKVTYSRQPSVRSSPASDLFLEIDGEEDAGCGRALCVHGERRRPWPRRWPPALRSGSVESGLRRGVRARLYPNRTLVTAPSSDRPSRSLLLCHGSGPLSSRRSPRALRRRGPAPPTASLPSVQPSLRRLRGV